MAGKIENGKKKKKKEKETTANAKRGSKLKTRTVYCASLSLPGRKLVNAHPNVSNLGPFYLAERPRGYQKLAQSGLPAATTG